MTTVSETRLFGGTVSALAEKSLRASLNLWRAWQRRRSVTLLTQVDDRMLADIGLTRFEVHSALAGPLTEDPTLRLQSFASDRRHAARAALREHKRSG